MTTRTSLMVRQPREPLQVVLVQRTWELADLLDDIEAANLTEHDAAAGCASHVWRARADVPAVLAPHVDADYLSWSASVEWAADSFASRWRIEPHALREAVSCAADVTLEQALGGRATRVVIDIDVKGLDGRRGVTTIAHRLVLMNWQKLVDAASRKLLLSEPET